MNGQKIVYETKNFLVFLPNMPHIPREDGGHLVITAKEKILDRTGLNPTQAIECMRLTMLVGEAMVKGLKKQNINIERINYQENGNWAYLRHEIPFFHIHLYGRTKNSKSQIWGEALNLPDPDTGYYSSFDKLTNEDIFFIQEEIKKLEKTDKYNLKNWTL